MKLVIVGVLAFCLVLTNGAPVDDTIQLTIRTMDGYAKSLADRAETELKNELDHKFEELFDEHVERVEKSIIAITEREIEDAECAAEELASVESVVENLESSLDICAYTATTRTASITVEIVKVSVDIAYDSYKLAKGILKCRNYKNSILKSACYAKQLINAKKLLTKTKNAVDKINKSVDETAPQILSDLGSCSAAAEEAALSQLELINSNIDQCIANKH